MQMKNKLTLLLFANILMFSSCTAKTNKNNILMAKNEEVKSEEIIKSINKGDHIYIVNSDIVGNLYFS